MPRFGKQFKVYDRILPSQLLDVTDVIENSPRQCIICGKLATLECLECNGEHGGGGLLDREDVFIIHCCVADNLWLGGNLKNRILVKKKDA